MINGLRRFYWHAVLLVSALSSSLCWAQDKAAMANSAAGNGANGMQNGMSDVISLTISIVILVGLICVLVSLYMFVRYAIKKFYSKSKILPALKIPLVLLIVGLVLMFFQSWFPLIMG